jgi:hypothetical protein
VKYKINPKVTIQPLIKFGFVGALGDGYTGVKGAKPLSP